MTAPSSVELVTRNHVITGRCCALERYPRLIDLLNNPDVPVLEMAEAWIRSLHSAAEAATVADSLFLKKDGILFAAPVESAQTDEEDTEAFAYDRVEKKACPALLFIPPFRVSGRVYLPREAELQLALPNLLKGFLAMTDAKAVHEGNGLFWERKFLAVNGQLGQMISGGPAQALPSLEAAA
jgi:hypothetical protein